MNTFLSALPILLVIGVIFVNGWTDAPSAITSCVCAKVLSMKKAVTLAAVCNFFGVFITSKLSSAVAENIFKATDSSTAALCASMSSVITLAVCAWIFGIPTSESHAIIAALTGATLASGSKVNTNVLIFTVVGLILSVAVGFILGYAIYAYIRSKSFSSKIMARFQVIGAAFMAFMHGAQDGQKFISIYIAAAGGGFIMSNKIVLICSAVMALGTAFGGGRIIKTIGQKMVALDIEQGTASDIAGSISLFLSTVLGMPVSTTHAKTAAVMGCGFVTGGINKKTASEMLAAWVITFPACFIMGYLFTKLFKVLI